MASDKLAKVVLGARYTGTVIIDEDRAAAFNRLLKGMGVGEPGSPPDRAQVHQMLLLAKMMNGLLNEEAVGPNVSYGYDMVRFLRPVHPGECLTTQCEVIEIREAKAEVVVEERLATGDGAQVAVAHHLYRFF